MAVVVEKLQDMMIPGENSRFGRIRGSAVDYVNQNKLCISECPSSSRLDKVG
jgi:hypothetical protein